jgi:ribonuclease BN (tRNA processing enzyme)
LTEQVPLVCLGSGAALTDGRDWGSLLLDGKIVLDLPPTAIPQLHRLKADFSLIEHIFISHMHADHVFGLPFLLLEYCVRRERENPMYVIGPPHLEEITFKLCELAWPDLRQAGFEPHLPLHFIEVPKGGEYRAGHLAFTAIPMRHFDLEAFGYRFTYRGRTIGYTGDTGECDQLLELLGTVDVAVIELTHPYKSSDPGHMDSPAFARTAQDLLAQGTKVIATHMSETPPPIPGVTLCEDGKTIWI